MGAWGYYDDENDCCCDSWMDLIDQFYQKFGEKTEKELSCEDIEKIVFNTLNENPDSYNFIIDNFLNFSDSEKIGLSLNLIKLLNRQDLQIQPLFGFPPDSDLNKLELPKNFPEKLTDLVIESIKIKLVDIENEGWADNQERKKALNHELYLFSKGKFGSNGINIKNSFNDGRFN